MSPPDLSLQTILEESHTEAITALEFSPDGKFLASGGDDGAIFVFSTSSWVPVKRYLDVSPVSVLVWDCRRRYLLLSGHQSGDVHVMTMDRSMVCFSRQQVKREYSRGGEQECTIQTSRFGGCIHSMSLSPRSPRIAIGHGNEIALMTTISGPNRLGDDRELLPKPQSSPYGPAKSAGPIAKSLHFMEKKNQLVVTYAGHGIVYVLPLFSGGVLTRSVSIWDLHTMKAASQIAPRTFPMYVHMTIAYPRSTFTKISGKSIVARDDDIITVSNLVNGVDWYSLSDHTFLSTTKFPAGGELLPSSTLTYTEDGAAVIVGGTHGSAHILGRDKGVQILDHGGMSVQLFSSLP